MSALLVCATTSSTPANRSAPSAPRAMLRTRQAPRRSPAPRRAPATMSALLVCATTSSTRASRSAPSAPRAMLRAPRAPGQSRAPHQSRARRHRHCHCSRHPRFSRLFRRCPHRHSRHHHLPRPCPHRRLLPRRRHGTGHAAKGRARGSIHSEQPRGTTALARCARARPGRELRQHMIPTPPPTVGAHLQSSYGPPCSRRSRLPRWR